MDKAAGIQTFPAKRRFPAYRIFIIVGAGISDVLKRFQQQILSLFIAYLNFRSSFYPDSNILYRLLSLTRAKNVLTRDGAGIYKGFEDRRNPYAEIEWIRRPENIGNNLPPRHGSIGRAV